MSFIASINKWFRGWPDAALSIALLALAIVDILAAIYGKPIVKAILVSWQLLP